MDHEDVGAATGGATQVRTFLIADIRGYTSFTNTHGDEAAAQLADRFAALTGDAVRAEGGELTELRGDEALAVFSSPRAALRCAVRLQTTYAAAGERAGETPIGAGIGIDVGEAVPVQGGYRTGALNLAARLCSIAAAGEVFTSEGVIHLARRVEGLVYVDRGEVQLKGLTDPVRVIQIVAEGAEPSQPAKFTVHVTKTANLPAQPTPFIGREADLVQVRDLVLDDAVRLVTLAGPGGTGKTRLALQAGVGLLDSFEHGVLFVSLAPVLSADQVVPAVLRALGKAPTGSALEAVKQALADQHLLVILDNFEHVMDAAPDITELLAAAPRVKVLVTSRELLREYGEHHYPVPPLSAPDPGQVRDPDALSQFDAVALFIARARAARHGFAVTAENAPAIAEICHRLDGLPLAIELAAARLRIFPVQALLARLDSRLSLLTGGARGAPERHQTLRAAIDWSYSLLTDSEQALFRRLALFRDGCTFEAAEAVAGADLDVLGGLASLVEKSMLRQEGEVAPRFRMLETLREYGLECLADGGEQEEAERRFDGYFLDLAQQMAREYLMSVDRLAPLREDRHNLQVAIRRAPMAEIVRRGLFLFPAMLGLDAGSTR